MSPAVRLSTSEEPTPPSVPEPAGGAPHHRSPALAAGYVLAGLLALVPVGRMVGIVLQGSHLQHADYWHMLERFTDAQGGLDVAGLFVFQNHPVVVPQLVYWFNLRLFAGSNISLGLYVIAVALAQLGVVALWLARSRLHPLSRMGLLVLASALLFNLVGTWNFSAAMSGTAWLTANLFAMVALTLHAGGRRWAAVGVASLAALSYGTGLAAWPALVAVGLAADPQRWRRQWPFVVGFLANLAWYEIGDSSVSTVAGGSDAASPGLAVLVRNAGAMMGFALGLEGTTGELVGLVGLVLVPAAGIPLLVLRHRAGRTTDAALWTGLAVYGVTAILQTSYARAVWLLYFGQQNRYASLASLTWLAVAGLTALAVMTVARRPDRGRRRRLTLATATATTATAVLVAGLLVPTSLAGREHADEMIAGTTQQELRKVAFHLGVADGTTYLTSLTTAPAITARMEQMGHVPFVDGWDADCGLLDQRLEGAAAEDPTRAPGDVVPTGPGPRDSVVLGGHVRTEVALRCIVVTDEHGRVVGAGAMQPAGEAVEGPEPPVTRFWALARDGASAYRVWVVADDPSTAIRVDGEVRAEDLVSG